MTETTASRLRRIVRVGCCLLLLFAFSVPNLWGQAGKQPGSTEVDGATVHVYKQTADAGGKPVALELYLFQPDGHQASDRRPAAVFFFGGGWRSGKPSQFFEHCRHLARRGMVGIAVDYRVSSRHRTPARDCVSDAKSAIRWVREHADSLGVDPDRIAAGGGSAGGHLAACTALIDAFDEPAEDASISSRPNALLLFNPALVLADVDGQEPLPPDRIKSLTERMGTDPTSLSPIHHVRGQLPPTILFHGIADKTVPYWTARAFAEAMTQSGNQCRLVGYEDQGHGFFNAGRKGGKFQETLDQMDRFLVQLGYLEPQSTPAPTSGNSGSDSPDQVRSSQTTCRGDS